MKVSMIGLDLAKNVFAVHGVDAAGRVVLRRTLRRSQVLKFFASLEPCTIGMEASSGAHYWGRELARLGHEPKLMPAAYVKKYVKRGKNDEVDAEACWEAVTRPNMRFVPLKSVEQQAALALHRARHVLVRQRTQTRNVIRALCAEFGLAAAKGRMPLNALFALIADEKDARLPREARLALAPLVAQHAQQDRGIAGLERIIVAKLRQDEAGRRLITIPGVGPLTASALVLKVGDIGRFHSGRHLAAWIGLTPKERSSGGKQKFGGISKQGDRYLRCLFVQGAMSLLRTAKTPKSALAAWLAELLARKPKKLAAIALANRLARIAWAVLARAETYRPVRTALKVAA